MFEHDYSITAWEGLTEDFILNCLEKTYKKMFFEVTNYHRDERRYEAGVDLLCEKNDSKIAIQLKIKPRQSDIEQYNRFKEINDVTTKIYVYIKNPTKPFKTYIMENKGNVELWDNKVLHDFLLKNESLEYYSLYLSSHPLIRLIYEWFLEVMKSRNVQYKKHEITSDEMSLLWMAKDNAVKLNISFQFILSKWRPILFNKTNKDTEEFAIIIEDIFRDFDLAYSITRGQFLHSIQLISDKHPDIIGLLWELASHRTKWSDYTRRVDRFDNLEEAIDYTKHYWICPVKNTRVLNKMSGFYSSMNYLIDHFTELGVDIEESIDWVFSKMVKPEG